MTKPGAWKKTGAVFLLCAATAIASRAQTFKTIAKFDFVNGANAGAEVLAQGPDGNLYGTSSQGGGTGAGTVFRLDARNGLRTLYSFCTQPNCADGFGPWAGLTLGTDSRFYGTTTLGGNGGTVFRITPGGEMAMLYSFCSLPNCADGYQPIAGLIQATDGNFYGTTADDGAYGNYGTLFKITPQGNLTTLHSFDGNDGALPYGGLVQATDRTVYGTTEFGGDYGCDVDGCGTVFRITLDGTFATVYTFGSDGIDPTGALIQATDGSLYGTTFRGGTYNLGTFFKITPQGALTTLYNFCAQQKCTDGSEPSGNLVQATDGNFYGTTLAGGGGDCASGDYGVGCGTVFEITPLGILTTLHSFPSPLVGGAFPFGGLLQATNGIFYGTADSGGDLRCEAPSGCGTIFSLDVGLAPFVTFVHATGEVGQTGGILGQGFTGTTSVSLNGVPANFTVVSDTYIKATVPTGATTGYATVTTPTGTLTSNVPFHVIP